MRNKLLSLLLLLFTVLLTLTLAELGFRKLGSKPGVFYEANYVKDTVLNLNPCYIADSNGIMKFSPLAAEAISNSIINTRGGKALSVSDTVKQIFKEDLVNAYTLQDSAAIFLHWADSILLLPEDHGYISALKDYLNHPINLDGFRSIAFDTGVKGKKKILFIGDSFTYGFSAWPLTNSFYDKFLMQGRYIAYNAGITCTDPVQYLAIAKAYIPILKPDLVVVSCFWGNDVMFYPRESKPYQFAAYPISNQFITANPLGAYVTPKQANRISRLNALLPDQDTKPLNRFLAKTIVGTKFWQLLAALNIADRQPREFKNYINPDFPKAKPREVTRLALQGIIDTLNYFNCPLLLAVIPDPRLTNPWNKNFKPEEFLQGIPYLQVPDSSSWYMPFPDGHFNTYGHAAYAKWLTAKIDSVFLERSP